MESEVVPKTQYSIDASLHYEALEGFDIKTITLHAFSLTNPNICFRDGESHDLEFFSNETTKGVYVDVIWSLDAESPAAANKFVGENLSQAIPTPPGLKLIYAAADSEVYDNAADEWVVY